MIRAKYRKQGEWGGYIDVSVKGSAEDVIEEAVYIIKNVYAMLRKNARDDEERVEVSNFFIGRINEAEGAMLAELHPDFKLDDETRRKIRDMANEALHKSGREMMDEAWEDVNTRLEGIAREVRTHNEMEEAAEAMLQVAKETGIDVTELEDELKRRLEGK